MLGHGDASSEEIPNFWQSCCLDTRPIFLGSPADRQK